MSPQCKLHPNLLQPSSLFVSIPLGPCLERDEIERISSQGSDVGCVDILDSFRDLSWHLSLRLMLQETGLGLVLVAVVIIFWVSVQGFMVPNQVSN